MRGTIRLALSLACAGALVGCGMESLDPPAPDPSGGGGETGLALTVDLSEVESVAGVRFIVETCEGEEVVVDERTLEELDFPEDDAFDDLEVAGQQGVIFADYFVVLEEGCYDVEIVPIDEDGEEVELCEPSLASEVEVRAGETTEIAMVSQCGGDNFGAMDVLGVLNFSPTLTRLDFDPSKLVACESLRICATAVDSDADDIEFEWEQLSGPTPREGLDVSSTSDPNADGEVVECVTLTPGNTAAYAFEVRAYDVIVDADDDRVRVEDLLRESDDSARSHARLSFPVYSTCEESPANDDEGVLGEVEDEPADDHEKDKERPEEEDVLGEVEDEPADDHEKDKERPEEEDVLGEVEDEPADDHEKDKERPEEEDVLGEVEEPEEEHKKKDHRRDEEDEEDVLGEVEDEPADDHEKDKERPEEEDVLGEVEEPEEEEHKKKDHRRDEEDEEDVLGEVEEPEEEEHKKKDHRDEDEEDVLGEVEDEPADDHEKNKERPDEEDVLGEVEEPEEEEHKKKDHRDEDEEDVLGEVEQCTRDLQYWRDYNRYESDPDRQVSWPISEDTELHGMTWVELVEERVPKSRAWAFMAQQYIVARLNEASGAPVPAEVAAVMAEAERLLGVEDPDSIDRVRAKDLMFVMRSYNGGHIGPGACGDAS
ncbi:hypothetical protein DV096_07280 [Bradymonadaceae bacterium TMQ3]|nr:hypothetical protein DV096_07280 [Bradymonadaceae bacterium TMQ3]TXC76624.1 hypothetical protein FRC91_07790 [Bradymonadales bacterium TMQ1]